jgi:hypothetical protein
MTNRESNGAVTMPPTMGAAMRLITSLPAPPPSKYWQQTGDDHGHSHGLGAHALHSAFTNGHQPAFCVVTELLTLGPGIFQVEQHDHAKLGRNPASAIKPTPVATDRLNPSR